MAPLPRLVRTACALLAFVLSSSAAFAQSSVAVTTRHAPTINGGARIEGSMQQLRGENVTLNGNATLTEDLLVPGIPAIQINGNASWQGPQPGSGAATPAGYTVTLGGDMTLRHVRTRIDPIAIPTVPAPPATNGTRNVELKRATDSAGNWATVRDLKVSGQAGMVAVPPGTYRDFTASGQTGLILGIAGATQPAAYNLQSLTLNGQARLDVVGPIVLTLNSGLGLHGLIGNAAHPEWLQVRIASGGVVINAGATLHAGLVAPAGTLQINGQGTFCGTAAVDRFVVHGGGLVRWRNTNLGGGNRPPTADSQNVSSAEETPVPITLTGSDPDGNSLAFTIDAPPQHGTLSGAAPNLIYTPVANFPATNTAPGTDTFTFTVHDGTAASAPATVTITITPVNDPPVAHAQQVVVTEDTPLILTLTGFDPDADALTFSIPAGQQMLGTVGRYTGPGATSGDFLYTPAPDSHAPDSFIFLVEDGHGGSGQATVTLDITPVDDIPIITPLQLTVPEHGALPITLTGVDPDGELLTLEPVAGSGPAHGALTGSSPDYLYTPDTNFPPTNTASGFDAFQYRAIDPSGDASTPALVTIQVTPIDDPPLAHSGEIDTVEDTAVAFVVGATDEENEPLTYEVQQQPRHGTLTGAGPTFVYTPETNFFGDDSFTFIAIDSADPSALPSALATVTLHINSRNDAPVAHAQGVITTEDTPVLIALGASDVDNDQLTFVVPRPDENGEVFGPKHGALSPTEDPKVWLYTPAPDSTEADQFIFQVRDPAGEVSAAVVSVVVTPINDYPVAAPVTLAVDEDQPLALTLSGVDVDDFELTYRVLDGAGLTLGTLTGAAPGLIYQSRPDFSGADFFDFIAIDSLLFESAPARVSITMRPVNDPPVAQELAVETSEDVPLEIVFTATDVEGDEVAFLAPTAPSYGLLEPLAPGRYRYTPDHNFYGTDTFTYAASDGQADSQPAAVTIRVLAQNDAPTAPPPPPFVTREDTPLTITLGGADIDGDALTILDPTAPEHGTLVRDPDHAARFIYTPAADYHGADTFSYAVSDGTMTSPPGSVAIEVEPVNDAPSVEAGDDATITLGTPAALPGTANDVDDSIGDGLTLAWTKVSGPGAVVFSTPDNTTSLAQFTAEGTYVLRLTAADSEFSVADEVTIIVAPGNQAPVVEAGADQTLAAPGSLTFAGTANDDGLPASSALRFTWKILSGPGAVGFTTPQQASTSATFIEPGTYVLEFTASDGRLATADTLTVTVARPNAGPSVNAGADATIAFHENATLSGQVSDDGLPQGAGVSVLWTTVSGPGAVQFADVTAAATSSTFPAAGTYVLRLSATDSELVTSDTVSVVVQPAPNHAPTVNAGPDQTLQIFRTVQLSGSAQDDGQPQGNALNFAWSKVSGPGTATFAAASSAVTTVSFSVPGAYVLRLTANDGELSASDDVNITLSMNNQAPFVNAGFDQTIVEGESATLSGEVSDDGLPAGQPITLTWSKVSGPGTVTFANSAGARTGATFSNLGTYALRLTASDSQLSASDLVTVTVRDACNPVAAPDGLVGFWKGEGNTEDARGEFHGTAVNGVAYAAGEVDLAFSFDGVNDYVTVPNPGSQSKLDVGAGDGFTVETWIKPSDLRVTALFEWNNGTPGAHFWIGFGGVTCAFADIVDASGGSHSFVTPAGLYVVGQWQHVTFTYDKQTRSCRTYRNGTLFHQFTFPTSFTPQTTYDFQVGRRPGHPTTFAGALDEVSLYNRALTLSEIQAIYNSGACGKTDGYPAEFPSVIANAGADQSIFLPQSATLAGSVIDRRLDRNIPLRSVWTEISGPGAVRFAPETAVATTAHFDTPGDYVLRLTVSDGTVTAVDDLAVHVETGVFTHDIRLQSGNGTSQDPLNRFTLDGGATWQPASLTSNGVYSVIPGTSYIVGQFVTFSSSRTRARFILPAGFSNPQLNIQFYADNGIRVYLNGTQIGQSPAGFSTSQLINYVGTFAFTAPASTALVTEASLFRPGENFLEIENFNSSGPMGADYLATVSFDAAGDTGNQPPVVVAGADRTLFVPASTTLVGTVADDALPLPDLLLTSWEKVSGPGTVVFSTPNLATTNATFSATGDYVLRLTAKDGEYGVSDTLKVTVFPALSGQNQAPVVSAGADLGVGVLTSVLLHGLAVDDGQPLATPQVQWQKVSGPGAVGFTNPHSAETNVTFGAAGDYVLSLAANDGQLSAADWVSITVSASTFVNQSPLADAGPDRMVQLPNAEVTLTGTAADDGLPMQQTLTVHWEIVTAPGAAELRAADQTQATVRFGAPGDYVFRITVSDGLLSSSDECTIYVLPVPSSDPLNTAPVVFAGNDQSLAGLGPAVLDGNISDDGRPGPLLTMEWTKVSGPGAVQFGDASAAQTSALFNAPGTYVLRLTASDGTLSSSDDVQIVAGTGGNQAPSVSAGPDRTGAAGVPLTLTSNVNDDGLPTGVLELTWSVVSGPGGVTLGSAGGASVQAQFAVVGAYTLRVVGSPGTELEFAL